MAAFDRSNERDLDKRSYSNQLLVHVFVNRTSPSLFVRSMAIGDVFVDFQHQFAVEMLDINATTLAASVAFGW